MTNDLERALPDVPKSEEAMFRARVREAVNEWRSRYALTPRETDVIFAVACGRRVADAHIALGCARSTVKSHARGVVKKTGLPSLIEAACALLREVSRGAFSSRAA